MTHSQTKAEVSGGARKAFVNRLREILTEYSRADLGATAAMAEVRAAMRQLDRQTGRLKHNADQQ